MISTYERILGAKLSHGKSTIIQLNNQPQHDWLSNTGCKVAARDEVVTYLGCPIDSNLSTAQEVEFLVSKVRKRLRH